MAAITGNDRPRGIVLTHVHPDHEGDARRRAERWRCPVWVSAAELPIALRDFEAMRATAMPLDRWVVLPAMWLMGRKRRERIFSAATLASVVRRFDPAGGVPGMRDWVGVPTPGTPWDTTRSSGRGTGCCSAATPWSPHGSTR